MCMSQASMFTYPVSLKMGYKVAVVKSICFYGAFLLHMVTSSLKEVAKTF